jgi:cyclophilin family peptidyl-prolyl cis-trans isomerase
MKKLWFLTLILTASCLLGACQDAKKKDNRNTKVKIETSMGDIVVRLYDETPLHRDNFIKLVKDGTYKGVLFHRVIDQFMIQAGDPTSKDAKPGEALGSGDVGYTIPAEIRYPPYSNKRGALAAARQGDNVNPKKESSGAQFYIVTAEDGATHLDGGYTVFGEVVEGMDTADKIQKVATDRNDRPLEDVRIKKMKIVE